MSKDSEIEPESTFPALEKPEFKSDIPEYLLKNAGENERYVLMQLSTISQYVEWSVKAQMDTNQAVRRTNGRLIKVEEWKKMFSSWKVLIGGIAALIGVVAAVVEIVFTIKQG